jgi:hypothetical protein
MCGSCQIKDQSVKENNYSAREAHRVPDLDFSHLSTIISLYFLPGSVVGDLAHARQVRHREVCVHVRVQAPGSLQKGGGIEMPQDSYLV